MADPNKPWQFQKGQSGNPKGRPKKGQSFGECLKRELDKIKSTDPDGEEVDGTTLMCKAMISLVFNKKINPALRLKTFSEIVDRVDGKPRQSIEAEITGDGVSLDGQSAESRLAEFKAILESAEQK